MAGSHAPLCGGGGALRKGRGNFQVENRMLSLNYRRMDAGWFKKKKIVRLYIAIALDLLEEENVWVHWKEL